MVQISISAKSSLLTVFGPGISRIHVAHGKLKFLEELLSRMNLESGLREK
jgi:hypothetical protein